MNHISYEVYDLIKSVNFFCNILKFEITKRPYSKRKGKWLKKNNIYIHLIETINKEYRKILHENREKYFWDNIPFVDHISFEVDNIDLFEQLIIENNIIYKLIEILDIKQIFMCDFSYNIIEVIEKNSIS